MVGWKGGAGASPPPKYATEYTLNLNCSVSVLQVDQHQRSSVFGAEADTCQIASQS